MNAVVDVDDAPGQVQAVAIGAAEAGAAAVVHVEHRDAAAGPELNAHVERARRRRGRPAVALDQQRRPLAGGAGIVGIVRRIEQAEGGLPVGGREFHALGLGRGSRRGGDRRGRECRCLVSARCAGRSRDRASTMLAGMVGRAGAKHDAVAVRPHRAEFGERRYRARATRRAADPARPDGRDPPACRCTRSDRARRTHRSPCRTPIAARRTPPPSAPARGWPASPARTRKDSTSRSDRTRTRAARRRATIPAGRSIRSRRRRSVADRPARHRPRSPRGRAWCRSTACWDDPTPARRASCRPATAAATHRNRGRSRARARRRPPPRSTATMVLTGSPPAV